MNNFDYSEKDFGVTTINNVLNRLGFSLKKVQKTKPLKRIEETDAIFENVRQRTNEAKADKGILRISVDVKDKVKVGELSRRGYSRSLQPVKALDKDQKWEGVLVPVGILEVSSGQSGIFFGNSLETSDLVADCIGHWARLNTRQLNDFHTIQINLDNGPHTHSRRTQFMKRMLQFSCEIDKTIQLVYYPPYHSKYNPIERVWAALENYWNGTLLTSVQKVINTAANMTWKGIHPKVALIDKAYYKGVRLMKKEMDAIEHHLLRNALIPKWDVEIVPTPEMRTLFHA